MDNNSSDYFTMFMKEVLRDLKKTKQSFVFNIEQVEYIKKRYKDIKVVKDDFCYHLTLDN